MVSPPAVPEIPKRKRGRPRKYARPEDGVLSLGVAGTATPPPLRPIAPKPPQFSSEKRGRGRPPGTGKKAQSPFAVLATGTATNLSSQAGGGFTAGMITVNAGEDVANRIMAFSQLGQKAVCVLSANGSIKTVTLRQDSALGGTATLDGKFEILSLSGSFLFSEVGGTRSRTGGLSVSLADSDGKVVGGSVSGLFVADAAVQIVLGSFTPDS